MAIFRGQEKVCECIIKPLFRFIFVESIMIQINMSLITSISGIRGTLGGIPGQSLTPFDIVQFTSSFGHWIKPTNGLKSSIMIGRDARPSGQWILKLVSGTLQSLGIDVIDIGLTTTPTLAMAVQDTEAVGGIMISASHNPTNWNALKLLNGQGECLNAKEASTVFAIEDSSQIHFASNREMGTYKVKDDAIQDHIKAILALPLVDVAAIEKANLSIAVDAINSTGGIAVPMLLKALGVHNVHLINGTPDGQFSHNPEPAPENLNELSSTILDHKCDLGLAVDPDVDRLAIFDEQGDAYGEEYTLVAVADYILQSQPGTTVSNLSSTKALMDVTLQHGGQYFSSPVGEAHVVEEMKKENAVIGGEGNGGIIYPPLHYGRDALVGIALFLTHLVKSGLLASSLRKSYPNYCLQKEKITLDNTSISLDAFMEEVNASYAAYPIDTRDGIKVSLPDAWVQLRKSNTEPILRIFAEAPTPQRATQLIEDIRSLLEKGL